MSDILSDNLRKQVFDLRHEPTRVMDLTIDLLESAVINNNAFILDPSQPLPFLLENNVVLTAAAVDSYEVLTMKQYQVMSQTEDDLYLHLSDDDMVGMFASPGEAVFTLIISKSEVLANAVRIDNSQSRKITIPKHTQITVNGLIFTLQHPVNIVIKPHGGIEIAFDGTFFSPLQILQGTRIDWTVLKLKSSVQGQLPNEYLRINLPMKQMRLVSHSMKSNPTVILKKTFLFQDEFFYARAYRQLSDGTWVEIKTTHSDHTFDPDTPTLMLKVIGNTVQVTLPHVYQLTSVAASPLRLDVYTTRGNMYMDLAALPSGQFVADFKDHDNTDNGKYSAPLSLLETFTILSSDAVSGGTSAPTFMQRRERVLNNSVGPATKPIAPSQVKTTLEYLGFDVTLNTDDAIGRTFKVSRMMSPHIYGITKAPIDSAVLTAKRTMASLATLDTVVDNGNSVTILPSTLYKDTGSDLLIVDDVERVMLDTVRNDVKVNLLSGGRYLYTPLHYVLDGSNNEFDVRPYYLTNPTLDIAGYSASNDTIDVFVQSSTTMAIDYNDTGYTLTVVTESNAPYKALRDDQIHVQLAFKPEIESEWVYINGMIVDATDDEERVIEFHIDSTWDITPEHLLTLSNFTMRQNTPQVHRTSLNSEWFLVWVVSDYTLPGMSPSTVDDDIGRHLLPLDVVGVYRETIQLRLGDELTGLWRRNRPTIGTLEYKTFSHDIPKVYPSNVYDVDPVSGNPIIEEVAGRKQLKILHPKGSPVLGGNGEPEYLFRKGEAMTDEFGELIPLGPRTVMWWWDVVLFDGQWRYATRTLDAAYTKAVAGVLNEWINDTLKPLKEMALERTEFNFQPVNSLRYVNALADDGRVINIYTAQQLVVDLYLTDEAYRQNELRGSMEIATLQTIEKTLSKPQVSKEALISDISKVLGEDVVTVNVIGLGGGVYDVVTLLDVTTRLSIGKILNVDSDGELSVKDNLTINFKRHGV